ncbi:hypothetical protein ACFLT4_04940 [Chloroflexota bacterium]
MESNSQESGFDELLRLSQETAKKEQELTKREQQRTEQRQKVQGVLQGLREIQVSIAVEQLRLVATPEIIKVISSLTHKQDTEDLRKLISNLVDDLEKHLRSVSPSNSDMVPIERSVNTLAILLELFFSLR